jgi:hypothetical protein
MTKEAVRKREQRKRSRVKKYLEKEVSMISQTTVVQPFPFQRVENPEAVDSNSTTTDELAQQSLSDSNLTELSDQAQVPFGT